MRKTFFTLIIFWNILISAAWAQVKIGTTSGGTPNPAAILDIDAANKGLLIPRVTLTSATVWALNGTASSGMVVYNLGTSTSNGLFGKGLYNWSNNKWNRMVSQVDISSAVSPLNRVSVSQLAATAQTCIVGHTSVIWDKLDDSQGGVMQNADNTRIDIPTAGLYLITATVRLAGGNVNHGERYVAFWRNGSGVFSTATPPATGVIAAQGYTFVKGDYNTYSLSAIVSFGVNEWFNVKVFNDTGANLKIDGSDTRLEVTQLPTKVMAQ